jgi:DNA topoisomerase-1
MTKVRPIITDSREAAAAARLVYVSDSDPGIRRVPHGQSFRYLIGNKSAGKKDLERIKRLVIPPAWTNVWICALENGHIQCTGIDALGRKQYRYHPDWIQARSETKYYRMLQFGEALPAIRAQIEKDLSEPQLCERKVLASVVSLMEQTYIRIGNSSYEKLYGSFGLTTLKDQHVKINGSTMEFSFKGKKGVRHKISIKNRKLARIVKQCRDIPGKELFQYKDADGNFHSIDSGMVNNYIKTCCNDHFTAKDFRTWAGSLHALRALYQAGEGETPGEIKRKIVEAVDYVSSLLGNTRTVCKKYYIHPLVLQSYETNTLLSFFKNAESVPEDKSRLSQEEYILLKLLKSEAFASRKQA